MICHPTKHEVVEGELVGSDPATDTAVIRIIRRKGGTEPRMRYLPRGESRRLEVGQTVYAIGNPFGLEHSMSRGIISGIARTLDTGERPIRGCIQTDATINPGNSGGPLLDSAGRVIGVNTAILTNTGLSAGVGLAIPIDLVSKNVEAIIAKGYVARAYLGITFAPDQVADTLQLPGIVVTTVVPGSPAEKAGIKPMRKGILGDVVTGVGDKIVRTGSDLFRLLDKLSPGETVMFKVQRPMLFTDEGAERVQELTLNVTLTGSPPRSVLQETILNITKNSMR
jgi:2-alkenal reductase